MTEPSWNELTLEAGPLRYLEAGTGDELVVFVHAVGQSPDSFRPQLADLPSRLRAVVPQLRGHGALGSEPGVSAEQSRVSALAEEVAEFVKKLNYQRAHFVGVSMGGVICQLVAHRYPNLVGSLALASTWAFYEPEEAAGRNEYIRGRLRDLDMLSGSQRDMKNLLAPTAPASLVEEAARIEGGKDPALFLSSWVSMFEPDLRPALAELNCPLLVIAAEHDPVTPARYLQEIAALVPGCHYRFLKGAGHFANSDHPAEFNAALASFWRQTPLRGFRTLATLGETSFEATTTAHALLGMLAKRGLEVLFSNSGTDYVDIIDAIARYEDSPELSLRIVMGPHENTVISMAHGWFLATGCPAAVMGHVNVGSANMTLGIINAARANVPMLVMAGRTPWLDGGARGARRNFVQWGQDTYDQASFREFLKWDYELRTAENLESTVDRALAISQSDPAGPAYLMLPGEVLARDLPNGAGRFVMADQPRQRPARAGRADQASLELAREAIAAAKRPLIVTAELGRYAGGPRALARFATHAGIGVVEFGKHNFMNMPTDLPCHLGFEPAQAVKEADLLIAIECHVPFIPAFTSADPGLKIIQIGVDPLASDLPARAFASDVSLAGDPVATLRELTTLLPAATSEARAELAARSAAWRATAASEAAADASHPTISKRLLSSVLGEVLPDDALVFNEYDLDPTYVRRTEPGTWFENSIASGLGWALGAALGAKLAQPDRLVVATLGDGSYLFNVPISAHFVANEHALPIVIVLFNDRAWSTIKKSYKGSLGDRGLAHKKGHYALCDFETDLDYCKIAEAAGGIGIRVDSPAALRGELSRALELAQQGTRLVLVDVRCERDG